MSLPAAFISVILIWSTTPLAIKWSALDIGPSFAVLSRMMIGAVLCIVLLALLRVRVPMHRKAWLSYTASGVSMFRDGAVLLVGAIRQFGHDLGAVRPVTIDYQPGCGAMAK